MVKKSTKIFKIIKVNKSLETSNEQFENCIICMGKLKNEVELNCCNHKFCFACMNKWIKVNDNCPICRMRIFKFSTIKKRISPNLLKLEGNLENPANSLSLKASYKNQEKTQDISRKTSKFRSDSMYSTATSNYSEINISHLEISTLEQSNPKSATATAKNELIETEVLNNTNNTNNSINTHYINTNSANIADAYTTSDYSQIKKRKKSVYNCKIHNLNPYDTSLNNLPNDIKSRLNLNIRESYYKLSDVYDKMLKLMQSIQKPKLQVASQSNPSLNDSSSSFTTSDLQFNNEINDINSSVNEFK